MATAADWYFKHVGVSGVFLEFVPILGNLNNRIYHIMTKSELWSEDKAAGQKLRVDSAVPGFLALLIQRYLNTLMPLGSAEYVKTFSRMNTLYPERSPNPVPTITHGILDCYIR